MQCEYVCGQTEEFFVEEKVRAPEAQTYPPQPNQKEGESKDTETEKA